MNKFAVLLLAIALSVVALAQNPVGKWKGSLKIDRAGIPKAQSPEQEKAVKQMLAQVESARFSLDMKGNKTFTVDVPFDDGAASAAERGDLVAKRQCDHDGDDEAERQGTEEQPAAIDEDRFEREEDGPCGRQWSPEGHDHVRQVGH